MGAEIDYGRRAITVAAGPLRGVDIEMNAISDTVPTLAVVALFAEGTTTIRGVEHIRHKETDRIAAVACELRKLGAKVHEEPDGLVITPGKLIGARVDTYDDHRMAMSFSLAGLKIPGVVIENPSCVDKTYPGFFEELEHLMRWTRASIASR
jgi:3-phosphoshikimate 1-carboxyvinyltransferase